MRLASIIGHRLRSLFSRPSVERELDEELQYHLERQIEENVATGMRHEHARVEALRSITGITQSKEECRDMRGFNFIDNLSRDFRYSLRQLGKNRGFTFTAIFVLALGMCAGLSIFSFVDAALIKPLPYLDPERLVGVFESVSRCHFCNISYPDYLDWKQRNVVFSSFDIYQGNGFTLRTPIGPQPVTGARVSYGFLHTLGIAPALGRDFEPGDDLPSAPATAMLSYAAWQQRYGGKSDVVGTTVTMDGRPLTIIGVLPREFQFAPAGQREFWIAYQPTNQCDKRRSCHGLYGVARLKDGVSMQGAEANVVAIATQLQKEYPDSNGGQGAAIRPLAEQIVGDVRPIFLVLLSGAALLLLIASVNVAGLQLVRSENRGREIAVRTALGASSGRLIGQFVTESAVLTASATSLGLLGAHWMVALLKGMISEQMQMHLPFLASLGLNWRVLAAAAGIALGSAAILSLPPAGRIWWSNPNARLAEASRGSAGTAWRRVGSKLVVLELATALVLLAGAGLLGKSLYMLLHVPIGIQPDHLVTLTVALPDLTYKTDPQTIAVTRDIRRAMESLPGVRSAGFVGLGLPTSGNGNTTWFLVDGRPSNVPHEEAPMREVGTTYFQTLGAKLMRGRYFQDGEDSTKPPVVIVNQSFVRKYFPVENPIGKQLRDLHPGSKAQQIIGVVEDIREGPLDTPIPPVLYFPFEQRTDNYLSLVVRTSSDERSLLPTMKTAIHQIDSEIVPIDGMTMIDLINDSTSAYMHRTMAWLVGGFAVIALILGVVGLYGVIAYSVSQRSREIGIRMALGAQAGSVCRLILQEASWLAVVGIGFGLAGAIGAGKLMRDLLFGVRAWDVSTLASVAGILGIAALVASLIPARRAASVDPVEALRAE